MSSVGTCFRLQLLVYISIGLSSGSFVWKLFFVVFVAFHRAALCKGELTWLVPLLVWLSEHFSLIGYDLDASKRKFIVRVDLNRGWRKDTEPTGLARSRGLAPQLELQGEVAYEIVCEGQHIYDEIIPHTRSETPRLQQNTDSEHVEGTGQSLQTLELTENVAYEKHSMTIDLKENVAYQGTCNYNCGPQQQKDLIYEKIN